MHWQNIMFFFKAEGYREREKKGQQMKSYYNSSSVCLFVPCVLRGPLTDLRQTWWVYVGWPPICPWGVLFRKGQQVNRSTGHFRLPLYYICASLTPHAAMAPFAVLHVNDVCRWTWQLLLRGSFSKRSTGLRVTFTFTILYVIADDARLTPPRCKKHTGSMDRQVNGSFSLSLYYMWSQTTPGSRHPAAKSTRCMMTPGSRHIAAKSTQRLLLARRVNFLVGKKTDLSL